MNTLSSALQMQDSQRLTPAQLATVEHVARERISQWLRSWSDSATSRRSLALP